MLLLFLGGVYLFEQPVSSLAYFHPRAKVTELDNNFLLNQFLGCFGHWSPKLCQFRSNALLGLSLVWGKIERDCLLNGFQASPLWRALPEV